MCKQHVLFTLLQARMRHPHSVSRPAPSRQSPSEHPSRSFAQRQPGQPLLPFPTGPLRVSRSSVLLEPDGVASGFSGCNLRV